MIEGKLLSRDPKSGLKRLTGSVILDPKTGTELPLFCLQQSHPELVVELAERVASLETERRMAVQCRFQVVDQKTCFFEVEHLECGVEARLRILVDLVEEGTLSALDALRSLQPRDLFQRFQISRRDSHRLKKEKRLVGEGRGNGLGLAWGRLVLDAESAWALHSQGEPVLLVTARLDLSARDALEVCGGVVSAESAPWFRDKPLLVIPNLEVADGQVRLNRGILPPSGRYLLDSTHRKLWSGRVEPEVVPGEAALAPFRDWLRGVVGTEVRCNLDSVDEIAALVEAGLSGVGLCRMELFFQSSTQRFRILREALNGAVSGEPSGLEALTAVVADDVERLLRGLSASEGGVLTLRFFDAPLSRMLTLWTQYLGVSRELLHPFLWGLLEEQNSTQGLRGGRFSLLYPTFFEAQVRGAGTALKRVAGNVKLQLMVPGVSTLEEVRFFRKRADEVFDTLGLEPPNFGMMLETPRACLLADRFVEHCDFFSFGTGDLTGSVFARSRYDTPLSFLPNFLEASRFGEDPFESLDEEGVGELMAIACGKIRAQAKRVEIGWCGAQAMNGLSQVTLERLSFDYVSVPLALVDSTRLGLLGPPEK